MKELGSMPAVHDNWEKLVTATLRREQLMETALRTPSSTSSKSTSRQVSSISSLHDSFTTYLQILEATRHFNTSKLMDQGHSGDLYFGVLDYRIEVVVKKVNVISWEKQVCLMSEIANHSSPRLVPLLGHCAENGNCKFLVYMSDQDLATYLRPDTLSLVWKTRLKITIGVMEGLYYLYHQCFPPLVQSGILLDEDFEVRLGSLTGACMEDKNNQQSIYRGFEQSNSDENFIAQACAVAFVAKACLSPRPSKCPDMAAILEAVELHNFVMLIGGKLKLGGKIAVHNHVSLTSRGKKFYLDGEILPCSSLRIFTFKQLMDATQNFGKESWLGRDEFGRVYQGLLDENGTELHVAVKRMNLKDDYKVELELVGRLSHPNILKPLGYCLEDEELLFVYEFMQKGSLKRYLYTGRSASPPLTWDMRLKILAGAARALAFLHESHRQGVFHHKRKGRGFYGYFKCSKVLLDSDYNAKITGFSVAEVDPPDCGFEVHPLRLMSRIDEYAAPEYKVGGKATGCSYLKSDVYGFGIVLVRMLSGRETHHVTLGITDRVEPLKFVLEKMDPRLQGKFSLVAAARMVQLAQLCVRQDHMMRPSMQQVVQILQDIETNPQYLG